MVGFEQDPFPQGAVYSGTERNNINEGVKLYVCRVAFQGGVHPGKLIDSSRRRCNFGWGGDEWYSLTYEVLIENGTWKTGSTSEALIGGREANGTPLYICQATVNINGIDHGTASGKVVYNACSIGYGGNEEYFSSYSLFYVAKPPPPPPIPKVHLKCGVGDCPPNYHPAAVVSVIGCGTWPYSFQTTCVENLETTFYTCGLVCPQGYHVLQTSSGGPCGPLVGWTVCTK